MMTRNALYLVIVAMGTFLTIISYLYYDETRQSAGFQIQINEYGLTVDPN